MDFVERNLNVLKNNTRGSSPPVYTYTPTYISEIKDSITDPMTVPPTEGDVAESGERDVNGANTSAVWWLRINGRWVNIMGTCESNTVEPVFGTESFAGTEPCLAHVDRKSVV